MSEVQPLEPRPESVALLARRHARARPPLRAALGALLPLTWEGHEAIPPEGPLLVLANHVEWLDPITLNLVAGRPVVLMGTESLAEGPFGRLLAGLGLVPKKKNTKDTRAVRLLKSWADAGAAVGLFPEGQRTWDGRPLPLMPGIEKLVLLLDAPVVTMRIRNGYRQWPRWAAVPRKGRVHIEVDPPIRFTRAEGAERVAVELARRLRVEPDTGPGWPVRGIKLASGLTNVLFACPACGRVEGLVERGASVTCAGCRASWRVTPECTLLGPDGEQSLPVLRDRVHSWMEQHGWRDPALSGEAVLESEPCELLDRSGAEPVVVGRGRLRLTPEAVRVDGELPWSLPLPALSAVTAEQRRRLWLRTKDGLFEPVLPTESVLKWESALERWRAAGAGRSAMLS